MAVLKNTLARSYTSPLRISYDQQKRETTIRGEVEWTVLVDDPLNDTEARVVESRVFPIAGERRHPDLPSLICIETSYDRQGLYLYVCKASYESPPTPQKQEPPSDPNQSGNPLALGWSVQMESEVSQEAFDRDAQGKPVSTILGEPFDPPLQTELADLVISLSISNIPFNPLLLHQYANARNSDWFLDVFAPGTCRMAPPVGAQSGTSESNQVQTSLSVRITVRQPAPGSTPERAWWKRVRAEGYKIKTDDDLTIHALDDAGEKVTTPVLHDKATGKKITDVTKAQWYEFEPPKSPLLSFSDFFNAIRG